MTLRSTIESLGLSGRAVESVVMALSATVVTHLDSTPKNYAAMVRAFGLTMAEAILKALKAAGLDGAAALYTGNGIDLSLDVTQQQLDALAVAVPQLADVCAALKAAGKRTAPQWQASGLSKMPTEDEIKEAMAELSVEQWASSLWVGVIQPAVAERKTIEEIKLLIAES